MIQLILMLPLFGGPLSFTDSHQPFQVVTPSDADRGCCVIQSTPIKCASSNRGYCRRTAENQGVPYKFHKGAQCDNVAVCPADNGVQGLFGTLSAR